MTKEEDEQKGEEDDSSEERRAVVKFPVDWTQLGTEPGEAPPIRYPLDVAEISPNDTELILVGTAGKKITNMGPDLHTILHPRLKQLILRSHMIRKMEGIQGLQSLELLELYDNQVDALQCLDEGENGAPGQTLRVLDMSYNVIRDMKPVCACPNLLELCTYNNNQSECAFVVQCLGTV